VARFWFVRHGESVANAEGWLAGHTDAPLTPTGRDQAVALRTRMTALHPQRVWSSDLARAVDTARLAWTEATPRLEIHPVLRERTVGAWETLPRDELRARGGFDSLLTWRERPPGGESQRDLAQRVLAGLATLDDGSDTLLFVHGGLIRVIVGLLDDTPVETIGRWNVRNTEIVERDVRRGHWQSLLSSLP